ncbi:MAG: ABC transporter permease [Candidatus Hodarchaeota archaeon]
MKQFTRIMKESLVEKKWIILFFGGIIGLLAFMIIKLLDDIDLATIEAIIASFPESFLEFIGDAELLTNPYGFLNVELFQFMWLYAGIFLVFLASSLVPTEVEQKIIDLSLTKPVSRTSFVGSKIVFLYFAIALMMAIVFLLTTVGIGTSQNFINEGLYFGRLWTLYVVEVLFLASLSMLAVFFSTLFLSTKRAMAVAIIVFFTMYFLGSFYSNMGDAEGVKYISFFFYHNPNDYLVYSDAAVLARDLIVLGSSNAALILLSLLVFKKKDIPI